MANKTTKTDTAPATGFAAVTPDLPETTEAPVTVDAPKPGEVPELPADAPKAPEAPAEAPETAVEDPAAEVPAVTTPAVVGPLPEADPESPQAPDNTDAFKETLGHLKTLLIDPVKNSLSVEQTMTRLEGLAATL